MLNTEFTTNQCAMRTALISELRGKKTQLLPLISHADNKM
jgi:hypothetical protein